MSEAQVAMTPNPALAKKLGAPALPEVFLERPLAHRALHDRARGRPENSRAAVVAAVAKGYGIEVDVQVSRDGEAMVFHDETLERLTERQGRVRDFTAEELAQIMLADSAEGIPTLREISALVAGRVPLLVEIKNPGGLLGGSFADWPAGVARALAGYKGPVAVMSFNPALVAAMAQLAPELPRGLTTYAWDDEDAPVDPVLRARLAEIADFDAVGAAFISHDWQDLTRPRVRELKAKGAAILCWTIRSQAEEMLARKVAHNITFEGYEPACPR